MLHLLLQNFKREIVLIIMKQMAHGHHIRSSQINIRRSKTLWFYF